MSHLQVPLFPRGFLLSQCPVEPPPTFKLGPLLPNFYVHPWTNVETAGDSSLFVIIIGHCVPTRDEQGPDPAAELLETLRGGDGQFLSALGDYSGRHAIIFGTVGNISVVNDATGMRAVFYAADGGVVASHAVLVEQALGGTIHRNDLLFRYGYPGNRTPFERTRILTPNTYYWMTAHVVRRFWPIVAPVPKTVDEAAAHLLQASTIALQSMAKGRTVGLTLTAGLDSRAVLAVAVHSGIGFHTYTYGNDAASGVDRSLARDLAARLSLQHFPVEKKIDDKLLYERVMESHYTSHHGGWVAALSEHFQDPNSLAVIGNLLEIGRINYGPARQAGAEAPDTADAMAALHYRVIGTDTKKKIRTYGYDRYIGSATIAFQAMIDETGYHNVVGLLDPFDQFYWEHRMAVWQGVAMGERDFYAEPFVPFNARSIFESMVGVPSTDRHSNKTVYRMIEMVDPELLELPVNPKEWPAKVTSAW